MITMHSLRVYLMCSMMMVLLLCCAATVPAHSNKRALGPPWPVCPSTPPSRTVSLPYGPVVVTNCSLDSVRFAIDAPSSVVITIENLSPNQPHVLTWTFPLRKLSDNPDYSCLPGSAYDVDYTLSVVTNTVVNVVSISLNLSRGFYEVFMPPMADAQYTLSISRSALENVTPCSCSREPVVAQLNSTLSASFCPAFQRRLSIQLSVSKPQVVSFVLHWPNNASEVVCIPYKGDRASFVSLIAGGIFPTTVNTSLIMDPGSYMLLCDLQIANDLVSAIPFSLDVFASDTVCDTTATPQPLYIPANTDSSFQFTLCTPSTWNSRLYGSYSACAEVHTESYQVISVSPSSVELTNGADFNDQTAASTGILTMGDGRSVSARNGTFFVCPSLFSRVAVVTVNLTASPPGYGSTSDAYEPNDSPSEARGLSVPLTPTSLSVSPLSDQDYFTFSLAAACRVRITFTASLEPQNTGLHFELRPVVDETNGSRVFYSRETTEIALSAGEWQLIVRVFPSFSSMTYSPIVSFDYVLGIEVVGPQDCPSEPVSAQQVSASTTLVNVTICPAGASADYTISTAGLQSVQYVNVSLLNTTLTALQFVLTERGVNGSIVYFTFSNLGLPSFLLKPDTEYTLSFSTGARSGYYTSFEVGWALLQLTLESDRAPASTTYEPNNSPAAAAVLPISSTDGGKLTIEDALYPVLDVDWFKFTVSVPSRVQWQFFQAGQPLNPFRGQPLNFGQVDLFAATDLSTPIPQPIGDLPPGDYYVRVSLQSSVAMPLSPDTSLSNLTKSPYELHLIVLPPCPCQNQTSTPSPTNDTTSNNSTTPAPETTTPAPSSNVTVPQAFSFDIGFRAPSPVPSSNGPVWKSLTLSIVNATLQIKFSSYNQYELNSAPYPRVMFFFDLDNNPSTGYRPTTQEGTIGSELLLQGSNLYQQGRSVFNIRYIGPVNSSVSRPDQTTQEVTLNIPLSTIRSVAPNANVIRILGLNDQTFVYAPPEGAFISATLPSQ